MTMQVSLKDSLPTFKNKVNEAITRRLETGPISGFRNYCADLSAINKSIIEECARCYITNSPSTDFSRVFTVAGGSAGRLECTSVSDFDFLALPGNKGSVKIAEKLQAGMNLSFKHTENLPFKFDLKNDFSRFHGFCTEPDSYPEALLVDAHPFYFQGIEIPHAKDPCRAHSAIRDFSFISGSEDDFKILMEICAPRLYPFSDNGDLENGKLLIQQMIDDSNELISKWKKKKDLSSGIKDQALRLLQIFKWAISARENIRDSKSFYDVVDRTTLISTEEKNTLKNTYENLLMVREARMLMNEQYKGNETLESIVKNLEVFELENRICGDFDRCVEIIKEKLPQIL